MTETPNRDKKEDRIRLVLPWLLVAAVLLPVAIVFLFLFGRFFAFFGDGFSSLVLDAFAMTALFFWFLTLVGLLLTLGVRSVWQDWSDDRPPGERDE